MREIKFRGKPFNGKWRYGNYAHIKKDFSTVKAGHYISNSVGAPFAFLVRPETVSQFTGLKDRNETEIYEGDILRLNQQYSYYVSFENGCFYLYHTELKDETGEDYRWGPIFRLEKLGFQVEVIGNIYENPELLKHKEVKND